MILVKNSKFLIILLVFGDVLGGTQSLSVVLKY